MTAAVSSPIRVSVGLLNGQTKVGRLDTDTFEPSASHLELLCPTKAGPDDISEVALHLPPEDVCYVAFHKAEHDAAEPPDEVDEYCVHLPGNRRFVVVADPAALDERLGFYGYPISEHSWFSQIYFYAHGVNAVEDKAPIGSLLVDAGVLRPEALEEGLIEQAALQNSPIGQILVERQAVSPEAVEQAAETQVEQSEAHDDAAEADAPDQPAAPRARGERRLRLGEVLVEAGLATEEDIEQALAEQLRRRGKRLGQVLVDMGIVSEREISKALARKFNLEFVDLDDELIDPGAVDEVPLDLMERFSLMPIRTDEQTLTLAKGDPLEMEAIDLLRFSLNKQIHEVVATPSQIERAAHDYIERRARDQHASELEQLLEELDVEADKQPHHYENDVTIADSHDDAIVRMVNQIIADGYRQGASDIHIEPNGADRPVKVRFRVDGICETYRELPAAHRSPLVARVKIMANLDITERRKPQDGKISVQAGSRTIELRVATVPTVNGNEDVVLRILASGDAMPLEQLMLSERNVQAIREAVHKPYGLILAVGPTGSGKTTTLHALLGTINDVQRKIWTAEDPVEITQPGLRQVQVKPDIGFNFASALRSFLRADPDVIMVGEMRDKETATIGIEASLTGHLVFSTLHTNSAPETVTRLVDMGLDPFSFADALLAVVAQRLARRLCRTCKYAYEASADEYAELAELYGEAELEARLDGDTLELWRADGCPECDHKGYRGRVGIHELLTTSEALREAIYRRQPVDTIREVACHDGMRTLVQDGVDKCLAGVTDLSQVLAVCSR